MYTKIRTIATANSDIICSVFSYCVQLCLFRSSNSSCCYFTVYIAGPPVSIFFYAPHTHTHKYTLLIFILTVIKKIKYTVFFTRAAENFSLFSISSFIFIFVCTTGKKGEVCIRGFMCAFLTHKHFPPEHKRLHFI